MARWQKSPNCKRRRRGFFRLLAIVLVLSGLGVARQWWLRSQQLGQSATPASDLGRADPSQPTPEFYGTRSALIPLDNGINARMVDRPDSTAPLALILTAPSDDAQRWAGVQSLLEQFGVGSLVVSPHAGDAAIRAAAERLLAAARHRSQPLAVIAVDEALDFAITLGGESSLADRSLVVLTPRPRLPSSLESLLSRAPAWLQRWLSSDSDSRLSTWRGRVLVVRAREDTRFDAVAANALAAGAHSARVLVVSGGGYRQAPAHPDHDSWREIADFIHGVPTLREEITVVRDTAAWEP